MEKSGNSNNIDELRFEKGKATRISYNTQGVPRGESLAQERVFFDEKGFANLLSRHYPEYDFDGTGWGGDPKKLMVMWSEWAEYGATPFTACLPREFEKLAPFSPYPVVFMAGTLQDEWRSDHSFDPRKNGLIPAWLEKMSVEKWEANREFMLSYLTMLIYGSDALIYNPERAGEYSNFEVEIAQALGLPTYATTDHSPQELQGLLLKNSFPNTFIPRGSERTKMTDFRYSKEIILNAHIAWSQGLRQAPNPLLSDQFETVVGDIFTRREGRLPWQIVEETARREEGMDEYLR